MEASHCVAGDGVAGEFVGIGTVGDGIAAFGAVAGALGEAGGGVVGVWADIEPQKANAPTSTADATVTFFTPVLPFLEMSPKPKRRYFVPAPELLTSVQRPKERD